LPFFCHQKCVSFVAFLLSPAQYGYGLTERFGATAVLEGVIKLIFSLVFSFSFPVMFVCVCVCVCVCVAFLVFDLFPSGGVLKRCLL